MIMGLQTIDNLNEDILLLAEHNEFSDELLQEIIGCDKKGIETLKEGHAILMYDQVKNLALAFDIPIYRLINGCSRCYYSKLAAKALSKNVYRVDANDVAWVKSKLRPKTDKQVYLREVSNSDYTTSEFKLQPFKSYIMNVQEDPFYGWMFDYVTPIHILPVHMIELPEVCFQVEQSFSRKHSNELQFVKGSLGRVQISGIPEVFYIDHDCLYITPETTTIKPNAKTTIYLFGKSKIIIENGITRFEGIV